MSNNYELKYNVDIVFCMDATGSMRHLLDLVKKNALSFYDDLTAEMASKGKTIHELRAKVIAFRDYMADGDKAMLKTDFFRLPEESEKFSSVVRTLKPEGGGDEPEDGLEALAYAMKSDWTKGGDKRRHIIVVWSDASTHKLGECSRSPSYPKNMVKNFDELTEMWDGGLQGGGIMDDNAKRLIIYAPDIPYWSTISENWDSVIHFPSEAGTGLDKLTYKEIMDQIVFSIA